MHQAVFPQGLAFQGRPESPLWDFRSTADCKEPRGVHLAEILFEPLAVITSFTPPLQDQ